MSDTHRLENQIATPSHSCKNLVSCFTLSVTWHLKKQNPMIFHLRDTDGDHIKCVLFAHSILDIDETHAHTHKMAYMLIESSWQGPIFILLQYEIDMHTTVTWNVWYARANRSLMISLHMNGREAKKNVQSIRKSLFRTFIRNALILPGNSLYAGTENRPYGAQRARVKIWKHQPRSKICWMEKKIRHSMWFDRLRIRSMAKMLKLMAFATQFLVKFMHTESRHTYCFQRLVFLWKTIAVRMRKTEFLSLVYL